MLVLVANERQRSGSDGLYYGIKVNKTKLLPFANKSAGHPIIDNPNLTQHPGYK